MRAMKREKPAAYSTAGFSFFGRSVNGLGLVLKKHIINCIMVDRDRLTPYSTTPFTEERPVFSADVLFFPFKCGGI